MKNATETVPSLACCECGEATEQACEWEGDPEELTTIEWMPEYLRESHRRAGNLGFWPHNSALRLSVAPCCLEFFDGDDWMDESKATE